MQHIIIVWEGQRKKIRFSANNLRNRELAAALYIGLHVMGNSIFVAHFCNLASYFLSYFHVILNYIHIGYDNIVCDTLVRNRVIVNSWFLEGPQKRSRRNQLIYRCLTKAKSIGSGQDPESGRQTVRRLWWMVLGVETGREVWGRRWIRIGFAKD